MNTLPDSYKWLTELRGLPNTIRYSLDMFGVQEVVGRGSNATIIAWRDELNDAAPAGKPIVSGYSDDDIAWCGLFAAIICYRRLKRIEEVVKEPLWARNWLRYGQEVATRRGAKLSYKDGRVPSLGDVLVFERGSGGHVGFYVGEDDYYYHVLGGNQSNKVCIVRIEKSRCLGVRRPPYAIVPRSAKPFRLAAKGTVSTNEA